MSAYQVKAISTIHRGDGVLVREFTFGPGESTPWHRHSQMTDLTYGLAGLVRLEVQGGEQVDLTPGTRCETGPGVVHRLINQGPEDGRVLLVQTGGPYDFLS